MTLLDGRQIGKRNHSSLSSHLQWFRPPLSRQIDIKVDQETILGCATDRDRKRARLSYVEEILSFEFCLAIGPLTSSLINTGLMRFATLLVSWLQDLGAHRQLLSRCRRVRVREQWPTEHICIFWNYHRVIILNRGSMHRKRTGKKWCNSSRPQCVSSQRDVTRDCALISAQS